VRFVLILFTLATFFAASAHAAEFENGYLSFALPQGWTCDQEETEFVCLPPHPTGQKSHATMILAAKLAGLNDTLSSYQDRLDRNPPATGTGSIVRHPALVAINGTIWVDATLFGSELPDFYTRYLATTKDGIAVLYTFSAHKSVYADLSGGAIQAIDTLRLHYRADQVH
jgi:hypothetical protein